MTSDKIESAYAFCTGYPLATIVGFNMFSEFAMPVFLTVVTGFVGGAAAILGKMFVKWIFKSKYKNNIN